MADDLIKTMLDTMAAGSSSRGGGAGGAGTGEVAAADAPPSETLPRIFCRQLRNLLKTLQDVFPENEAGQVAVDI